MNRAHESETIHSSKRTKRCLMKNVLEMLEQTAERYPERTAVSDQQTSLTWAELRRRAGGIGAVLADELEGNQPVVVFAAKRVATLAIQLGVVYAGGFYVPVSRDQPAERIGRILRRLGRPLVIAADSLRSLVEETGFAPGPPANRSASRSAIGLCSISSRISPGSSGSARRTGSAIRLRLTSMFQ